MAGYSYYRSKMVDPDTIADDVRLPVMRAATKVVAKRARAIVPKQSGLLRKSIKPFVRRKGKYAGVAAKAPHGRLVHDGTKPHIIKAKNSKALKLGPFTFITGAVNHPGSKAQPFLTDAAEQSRGAVEAAIQNVIDKAAAAAGGAE